jgi:hypothetical protein
MKLKLINFLKSYYPVLFLLIITGILFAANYKAGTYLTGWDNLHPEFNFQENIKRAFFGVWQEYQGLGLLGGMGHASDLFREIFLSIISLVIPNSWIRYFWVFLTLFAGSTGAYFLIKKVLSSFSFTEIKLYSLTGAIFYLLSISTIQTFIVPFEAFIAHYMALPWIILASLVYLEKPNLKNALIAAVTFFLLSSQAYIPTLFISSLFAITLTCLPFIFRGGLRSFIKLLLIILATNAYWLLPFLYFLITNSSVNMEAKINQMATDLIFLQNKEYGNLLSVVLLKGYLFSNVEPDLTGHYKYILDSWKTFYSNPAVVFAGILIFVGVLAGLFAAIKQRAKLGISFALLFIFGFTMLATTTPPFSLANDFLRSHIPLFNQAFRFPYTKFLNLAEISYAVLFSLGLAYLGRKIGRKTLHFLLPACAIILIILMAAPAFSGHLLYEKVTRDIPQDYLKTFAFFNKQDPNTRIANFPQYTYWGWSFYDWGYSGSGFLWYGLKQPILDRAFDVWSSQNENYYWEINRALYSKDSKAFDKVLNKYGISWLLIDESVVSPSSPKSLFVPELKDMIATLPDINESAQFGKIRIYKVDLQNKPQNFISSLSNLSSANSYNWSDYDQEYERNGDYQTLGDQTKIENYYPFRSLFTDKAQSQLEFKTKENKDSLEFIANLPEYRGLVGLHLPSLITKNQTLPVNIYAKNLNSTTQISLTLAAPTIYLNANGKTYKLWENKIPKELFNEPTLHGSSININGVSNFLIPDLSDGENKLIGTASLSLDQDNVFVLNGEIEATDTTVVEGSTIRDWFPQEDSYISLPFVPKNSTLVIRIPKPDDKYSSINIDPATQVKDKKTTIENCDNFRKQYFSYFIKSSEEKKLLELSAQNATSCISFYLSTLDHDQGYAVSVDNQNVQGQPLHFWVLNEDEKTPIIDTYFQKSKKATTSFVVLPPMEAFGKAYSLHLENVSIGNSKVGNLVGNINVTPIPYYFVSNIRLENTKNQDLSFMSGRVDSEHPNQSLYLVKVGSQKQAIALSQAYDKGWVVYKVGSFSTFNKFFPFFGKKQSIHLELNNWENGWILESGEYAIIYMPQYLEYLGLSFTVLSLVGLTLLALKRRKKKSFLVDEKANF